MLYEDDQLRFAKEFVNEFVIENKKRGDLPALSGGFEALVKYMDLGEIEIEGYRGKTIVDYMRDRAFPLTFIAWI